MKTHRDYKVTNVEWHLCVGELLKNLNRHIGAVEGYGYVNNDINKLEGVNYWYERNTHYHLYLFGVS